MSSVTSARCHDDVKKYGHTDTNVYGSYSDRTTGHTITFIEILFNLVELLIKHGKLLLSVCMLLFLHLK